MNMKHAYGEKVIHHAAFLTEDGNVSALCYVRPHKIDLSISSWSIRPEAVTCRKCKSVYAARKRGEGHSA